MQTLVQIYCKGNTTSLRQKISNDEAKLDYYNLKMLETRRQDRSGGWAKLRSYGNDGTLNLEWRAKTKMLEGRIVNRGTKPDGVVGDFVAYMLGRHSKVIKMVNIVRVD